MDHVMVQRGQALNMVLYMDEKFSWSVADDLMIREPRHYAFLPDLDAVRGAT